MQTRRRSSHQRTILFLGVIGLFAAQTTACTVDLSDSKPDPRLGREKRVFFSSGCSSSTAMAIGGTETITIDSAQENVALPADLTPKSTAPTIIEVTPKTENSFDMKALAKGTSNIEVWSAGARYDWLPFSTEPAKKVLFDSKPSVIAGGRLGIAVTETYGACGTDKCPLFGHGFMKWSAAPTTAISFLESFDNLAYYQAGTMPVTGELIGNEPSEGGELIRHSVEIVDPAMITGISGQWFPPKDGDTEPPAQPFPATVAQNTIFTIQLFGERAGKSPVPIARHDIQWVAEAGLGVIPQTEPADPYVDIVSASDKTGLLTLTAKIAILGGKEQSFSVNVTP